MENEYNQYQLLEKDGKMREELQQRELDNRKRLLHDAQQKAMYQQNRVDGQAQERNIIEKRLEECDVVITQLVEGLNKQEKEMVGFEAKIQEKIAGAVRSQVKNDINQYKFDIYRSRVLD